jgi:hypothetical protein
LKYPLNYLGIIDIYSDYECKIYIKKQNFKEIKVKLLLTAFDDPILLFFDEEKKSLYCFYNFDISNHLLIFDINKDFQGYKNDDIMHIVKYSAWYVREANNDEIDFIHDKINELSTHDLRKFMMPRLGLGLIRYYLNKNDLIRILKSVHDTNN